MPSLTGLSFGRYHLLEPLGEGGEGRVLRGGSWGAYRIYQAVDSVSSNLVSFRCATNLEP